MNRSLKYYYFLIFLLTQITGVNSHAQEIKENIEQVLYESFGDDVKFNFTKYTLPKDLKVEIENIVQQRFFGDFIYIYNITRNDTIIAYGFLDNVYGKSLPITFFVILDKKGSIISTDIIKYREPYGGAIRNKNWNDQFSGLNSNSEYDVGKNIVSISGATISVHSVTKGIRKITLLYEKIQSEI